MTIQLSTPEVFVVASDNFREPLAKLAGTVLGQDQGFFGYCFHKGRLRHYRGHDPDLEALWDSYPENCGVFAAVRKPDRNTTQIFTDPLGQYPVFYHARGREFFVSNDFWLIARLASEGRINEDCAFDYVSYYSPLNQETLAAGVRRLTSYETIRIRKGFWGETLEVVKHEPASYAGSYDVLLGLAAVRFRQRAAMVLEQGTPVVHLSGGGDSRLAFAALAACGYAGPVFSFGDGTSQDRLIFEALVERMRLSVGPIKWFNGKIHTAEEFLRAIAAFNGLKSNSFSNWGPGRDDGHMEITGFYGEGLLKGFGKFWGKKRRIAVFDHARTISAFPAALYDHVDRRMRREALELLDRTDGHALMAETWFYLRNRSAAHFGMHSVVNNRKFKSIDLIYDPMLLSLFRACPYPEAAIKKGAIIIDLIRAIHSQELAVFPYDNRVVPVFNEWSRDLQTRGEFNCFSDVRLVRRPLTRLDVAIHQAGESHPVRFPGAEAAIAAIEEINGLPMFSGVFERLPILKAAFAPNQSGRRDVERSALAALTATVHLVAERRFVPGLETRKSNLMAISDPPWRSGPRPPGRAGETGSMRSVQGASD